MPSMSRRHRQYSCRVTARPNARAHPDLAGTSASARVRARDLSEGHSITGTVVPLMARKLEATGPRARSLADGEIIRPGPAAAAGY